MKGESLSPGASFFGSHLCERLLAEGHRVFCLDNFQTGRLENISHLLMHRDFRLLKHDIVEPLDLRVDEIYNLACPASPVHYQADPIQALYVTFGPGTTMSRESVT